MLHNLMIQDIITALYCQPNKLSQLVAASEFVRGMHGKLLL
jgi:hypothetical protein